MKVVGLQTDLAWEDPEANRRDLEPRIRAAAADGAGLVVLPEMWPTGFSMAPERVGEDEGGPSERFMADLARSTGAALCGSIARRAAEGARARNVCVVAQPDGTLHHYAKIHPFRYGGEAAHYEGGTDLLTLDVAGVRTTPLVCYDLRFPELFALAALATDLFVVVANWPAPRAAHWRTLLVARAMESQAYVLGVNRVGAGGGLLYLGESLLIGPGGDVLAAGAPSEVGEIAGTVDADRVTEVRTGLPFLRDRRPDLYRRLRGED